MIRARDLEKIFALQDKDKITGIGIEPNYLCIKYHFRKRVIFIPHCKPYIREAYDQIYKYYFKDQFELEAMYERLKNERRRE